MGPWGHRQRARGQGGHEGYIVWGAAQGEGVIRRAGEAHGIQRAVNVLSVQTIQGVERIQSVMVVSVVPLIRRCSIALQLLHLNSKQLFYSFITLIN